MKLSKAVLFGLLVTVGTGAVASTRSKKSAPPPPPPITFTAPRPAPSAPQSPALQRQVDISLIQASTIPYGNAGEWSVRIDQTTGGGCFIVAAYENGTVIRYQYDATRGSNVFFVGSNYWRSIEDGDDHPLSISFDGKEAWSGKAAGATSAGIHWLSLRADDAEFLSEFSASLWFTVDSGSLALGAYEAGEIKKALAMRTKCQAMADAALDPFAAKPPSRKPMN